MYAIDPTFWTKLTLMLIVFIILLVSFNVIMRKWLKVEKKHFFSYNHVNKRHKKIDWTIRILTTILLVIGFIINNSGTYEERFWYFESWTVIIVFVLTSETVRAYMEWKYAENQKEYILTISQLGFMVVFLIAIITTNFFGII